MFTRFDTIHERDRHQTDVQTDRRTPHDGIGRAYVEHRAQSLIVYLDLHNLVYGLNLEIHFANLIDITQFPIHFCTDPYI